MTRQMTYLGRSIKQAMHSVCCLIKANEAHSLVEVYEIADIRTT